jgi:[ribosomal protein S5]-alanine N-acetyltransferase
VDGQREDTAGALERHEHGTGLTHVIVDRPNALSDASRSTASLGCIGTGAFENLRLHCVQAETLLHNVASQRVLERNGFVQFGTAPRYVRIAGRWQDHLMFQKLNARWCENEEQ